MKHTVTLRNGVQVPALGLGTWFLGEIKQQERGKWKVCALAFLLV